MGRINKHRYEREAKSRGMTHEEFGAWGGIQRIDRMMMAIIAMGKVEYPHTGFEMFKGFVYNHVTGIELIGEELYTDTLLTNRAKFIEDSGIDSDTLDSLLMNSAPLSENDYVHKGFYWLATGFYDGNI